jgi:thioredoxin 1
MVSEIVSGDLMPNPHTLTLTDATFESEVLQSQIPVLVDFWAEGCGGCRRFAPVLDLVAPAYSGKTKLGKIDVLLNSQTAMQYQVRSLPTLLLFKGGAVVAQSVGVICKADIENMLDLHI